MMRRLLLAVAAVAALTACSPGNWQHQMQSFTKPEYHRVYAQPVGDDGHGSRWSAIAKCWNPNTGLWHRVWGPIIDANKGAGASRAYCGINEEIDASYYGIQRYS